MAKREILILGGGFAGVYTALYLEKALRPEEASISLVNRENYFVYQPLLPEVVSGSIGITDIVSPIRRLCRRTKLIMRQVREIDLEKRIVTVSPGFRPRTMEIPFDHLVISLGGITNFYGMPGMVEHALPFRTLSDAIAVRNHLVRVLEEADVESNPELRRKLLTFVVAGGGFSGVEVIAELNDFVRAVARIYPRIQSEEIRCVLVHSGDRILPEMVEGLAMFAHKLLTKRGVEVCLKDRLGTATSEKAILKSGNEIPSKTIISTVPSAPAPVLQELDCPKARGRLLADTQLQLHPGYEGHVWVLGDCASIKTESGTRVPPTAQHATREAKTVADNIAAAIHGGKRTVFDFEGLGKLGSLGHHSAVAEILGVRVSGFLAWLIWRFVYLMKMPGISQKFRVASDWFINLLFPPDLVQLKVDSPSGIFPQHFEPGEVVFNQGDLGDSVYVIQSGECEVLRESDGQQDQIATLGSGDYFGEMAVLSDLTRGATVKAAKPTNVLVIPKDEFDLLKENVPVFDQFFRELAESRADPNAQGSAAGADPSG